MEYPNNLRRLRDARRLTQADVAEALGINQAEYSRIEKGRRRIGTHLAKLAEFLACDEDDILSPDSYSAPAPADDLPFYALPEADGKSVRFDLSMTSRLPRPPILKGRAQAFGMLNPGDAMVPRLKHGDFIFADPDEAVRDDDIVVLVLMRGNRQVAIVRQYVGADVYLCPSSDEEESFGPELLTVAPVVSVNLAR